ncbi:PolB DNA polymerase elongation subunit (family B) [uncultured Caudovirales phage]|uniref:DNA-directed DNA polymerase n=1 Tax=uncultured Caudovirales phage TaxID=2100421 RepID=A0A6J5LFC8_9CAUD|nr:PolB DNA polymerase elongation subunit (family B) [uncultured Caudovirales phage]
MKTFYTNVQSVGNNILFRGVIDGKRVKQRIEYSPSLFVPSKRVTNFTTLEGDYLDQKIFGTIREARDYVKQFEGVSNGHKIYGNTRYEYAFIADQHKGMIEWDYSKVLIAIVDIEVGSENGFPDPYQANEPITAITIRYVNGQTVVFGCGIYEVQGDEVYIKCRDEWTLCKKFMELWNKKCPDVISGWNTKFFDIPYLINRFERILGENESKKLSPWNMVHERKTNIMGRELIAYDIMGVSSLDYIELYKWYAPGGKSKESYKLGDIAQEELGEGKVSFEEFDNLHQLYRLNYQKFIEYNIKDVDLISKMENKLKLFELALTLAYDTKSNFDDVFAQTRMWDSMTYSYLLEKNIIVPPKVIKEKSEAFEGAYVKEVQVGKHDWVASFDLNSLYPHLIMQYNISPETLIQPQDYTPAMREIISSGVSVDKLLAKKVDTSKLEGACLTPNGQFFRTDIMGFLPKMMEEMYEDRKKFKNLMLQAKKEYEVITDESKRQEIENRIARYENLQLAKKVSLNSAYGALGSQYFRFYDLRMALGVTTAGQFSIRWIEAKINDYMNKILNTDADYVIASDTDSIYLRLGELVNKVYGVDGKVTADPNKIIEFMDRVCEDKIQPYIDKSYQELADYVHAYAQKMQMKREGLSDKGIWTAKKRYILNVYNNEGVQYKEPKMKVMGLEMIKSSTPSVIRGKMKESIEIMIKGTEEDVHKFIADFREEFDKFPPEEISFPRGLNGLTKYADSANLYKSGTPIHVKGAILYNNFLKQNNLTKKYQLIQEGEKVKFAYLKTPNHFKDTVISFPTRLPTELGLHDYIDYEMQFNKSFLEPIKVILDCMGWTTEKQSSLADFFG